MRLISRAVSRTTGLSSLASRSAWNMMPRLRSAVPVIIRRRIAAGPENGEGMGTRAGIGGTAGRRVGRPPGCGGLHRMHHDPVVRGGLGNLCGSDVATSSSASSSPASLSSPSSKSESESTSRGRSSSDSVAKAGMSSVGACRMVWMANRAVWDGAC